MATLRKGAVTLMLATTGKSDPFVVFHLNGQRVYKSQTKKKTLTPEWNENFVVQVVCNPTLLRKLNFVLIISSAFPCWSRLRARGV